MCRMLKSLLEVLLVSSAVLAVLLVIAYFFVRAAFVRLGERTSAEIERRLAASFVGSGSRDAGLGRAGAADALASIERMVRLMDHMIPVPIIGGIGLDALLGVVPVVGDVVAAGVSLQVIRRSLEFGLPRELICKMLANTLTDVLLGLIPVVGDFA